jgi:hypothetical protein
VNNFISKTLGGLSKQYYFRQLFFGLLFFSLMVWLAMQSSGALNVEGLIISFISTLLYPYSRFVYESIIGFVMGDNTFHVNSIVFLVFKVLIMAMCWGLSIFIAPIGLLYLYYHHSKLENT